MSLRRLLAVARKETLQLRCDPRLRRLILIAPVIQLLVFGYAVSTVSATQQEAFLTVFLVFMPTILLSGFLFPVASMPVPFQWLTWLNPLRHYLEIVRGVFLKGAGLDTLWPQHLALLLMGAALLALAASRFEKRVKGGRSLSTAILIP